MNSLFKTEDEISNTLSNQEFEEILQKMKNGDKSARDKIIKSNIKLVIHIAKKYYNLGNEEDLVSIGIIGLIKAVDTYDINKGKFSIYAGRCVENEILMHLRKFKKYQNDISINQVIATDNNGNDVTLEDRLPNLNSNFEEDVINDFVYEKIREEVEKLPEKYSKVIMLYYGFYDDKRYTEQEIANMLGITKSYVSRLLHGAIQILNQSLYKEKVIEKKPKTYKKIQSN